MTLSAAGGHSEPRALLPGSHFAQEEGPSPRVPEVLNGCVVQAAITSAHKLNTGIFLSLNSFPAQKRQASCPKEHRTLHEAVEGPE